MKRLLLLAMLVFQELLPLIINAQQNFQTAVVGRDVVAEVPWRMKKTNRQGNLNGIPIHIFIQDANLFECNANVIYISIYLKNADDASFGSPVVFDTYSDSAFYSLFSSKSQTDADWDIQSFDAGLPVKDSNNTIQFTSDYSVLDDTYYVNVNRRFWYFTITIPPEKLAGLDDAIDIEVYFSLDWETDDIQYFRVFRYDDNLPKLSGWYRGDPHYHTVYTNNSAEFGLPLSSTKEIAKAVGLDWVSSTNHSCDYDNYGLDMKENWNRETSEIQSLNSQDTSMIFIHGMEASVNNSAGQTIHMLSYPNPASPYAIPYLGDGNGDTTPTSISINDLLDSLTKYGGFSYAAHPFAGQDKLSSLINGGVWNVSDADFLANGAAITGHDVVICNDLSNASDVFSPNSNEVFKDRLKGGQIWNYRNALKTTDQKWNPWNDTYDSGITPFAAYDTTDTYYHYNRFLQNIEVAKFLNIKALRRKNADETLQNYRFYFSSGSDAHGDFNFSNTNFVYGFTLDISDAAIGKPSVLVYCPSGMGSEGGNILSALKKGRAIMSDGPVISEGLDINNDQNDEYICGDEFIPDEFQYLDSRIHLQIANTPEFGVIQKCKIIFGSQNGEHEFLVNVPSSAQSFGECFSLDSLISLMEQYDTILDLEYFYVRSELHTHRNYGPQSAIYCDTAQDFHSYTNPIWIKKPAVFVDGNESENNIAVHCFPNPFSNELNVFFEAAQSENVECVVTDITGRIVVTAISLNSSKGENLLKMDTENLSAGIYMLHLFIGSMQQNIKVVKLDRH